MKRQYRKFWSLVLSATTLAPGCAPQQPFYCREDGDLSHYLDVATELEYPDVNEPSLDEVNNTRAPLTLKNTDDYVIWDLTLQEAVQITLCNSQVMRKLGGQASSPGLTSSVEAVSRNIVSPVGVTTTYDTALQESATGLSVGEPFNGQGVEAALSAFDAQLDTSVFWEKNREAQNANALNFRPNILAQDSGNFTSGITKTAADGTTFGVRNNTTYIANNIPSVFPGNPVGTPNFGNPQLFGSAWTTNMEATFSHPFLQGGGAQYNRIAGPLSFDQYAAGVQNPIDGVIIARIRTDQTLADFEGGVRDLVRDVEANYWELYFRYRDLEARKMGRDSALATWKIAHAKLETGSKGGEADREAQSRSQYFLFRAQVEQALTDLYRSENRLRYLMGLSTSDGRLIRPSDEPTTAKVAFDWSGIHCEALSRRTEIRKQKWEIKRREMELIAARNLLLPRLDAVGRYRWQGLGDELFSYGDNSSQFAQQDSSAFGVLADGEFQNWQLGLQLSVPLGFRQELSGVRHHELLLARDRAILQDLELEISHQLGDAIRDLDLNYGLVQTNFNRRLAAETEVATVNASYLAGRVTLDLLLDAQRRRAEAESAYYQSLVDYNTAIMNVHYRKGSVLEYDGVYLAEGEWPGKAYFDALRQARKRDAGLYMDYGYTRPRVFSQGTIDQGQGCTDGCETGGAYQGMEGFGPTPEPGLMPDAGYGPGETLPAPGQNSPTSVPPQTDRSSRRPAYNEHATNHAAAATAANPPVWRWAER